MKISILVALAALIPQLVLAEPGTETAPSASKPIVINTQSLRPGDGGYTQEIAAQGLQGTAEISAKLAPDGTLSAIAIKSTSRSEALDEIALELVRKLKFKAKEDRKPDMEIIVPVEFLRDSFVTLNNKTCAEFNVDAGYFKKTFPEKSIRDMSVINMSVGAMLLLGPSNVATEKKVKIAQGTNEAANKIEDACTKEPGAGFFKTFTDLAKGSKD